MLLNAALLLLLSQTSDEWAAKAKAKLADGQPAEAVSCWSKAIQLAPDRADLHLERGRARRSAKDGAAAIEDFGKALELKPGWSTALIERGYTWQQRKNESNAKADYDRAVEADPGNSWAWYRRGILLRRQRKHPEGTADLKKGSEVEGDGKEIIRGRAYCKMALGNLSPNAEEEGALYIVGDVLTGAVVEWTKGALQELDLLLQTVKDDGTLLADRASVNTSLGRFKEAEADLRSAMVLAPKSAYPVFELGRLMEHTSRPKEALEYMSEAIRLDPKFDQAWFGRANAKLALGDSKGVVEDLTKALQLTPKWSEAYFNRSLSRMKLGDAAGASADLGKVIEYDTAKVLLLAAYVNRGYAKRILNDAAGAKRDFLKAAGMEAPRAWDLQYRALAKENLDQFPAALADLEKALPMTAEGSGERQGIQEAIARVKGKK